MTRAMLAFTLVVLLGCGGVLPTSATPAAGWRVLPRRAVRAPGLPTREDHGRPRAQYFHVRGPGRGQPDVVGLKDALFAAREELVGRSGAIAVRGTVELERVAVRWWVVDRGGLGSLAESIAQALERAGGKPGPLWVTVDFDPGAAPRVFEPVPLDGWEGKVIWSSRLGGRLIP